MRYASGVLGVATIACAARDPLRLTPEMHRSTRRLSQFWTDKCKATKLQKNLLMFISSPTSPTKFFSCQTTTSYTVPSRSLSALSYTSQISPYHTQCRLHSRNHQLRPSRARHPPLRPAKLPRSPSPAAFARRKSPSATSACSSPTPRTHPSTANPPSTNTVPAWLALASRYKRAEWTRETKAETKRYEEKETE